jgi:tRNA G18 (ribose-2'-O)-methylase SpoU
MCSVTSRRSASGAERGRGRVATPGPARAAAHRPGGSGWPDRAPVTAGGQNGGVLPTVTMIGDPDDERIADYRALTDVELRTRWEPPNGLFIAEGELVLRRALRAGYRLRSVLVDAKRAAEVAELVAESSPPGGDAAGAPATGAGEAPGPATTAPLYAGTQDVLQRATGFHVHRGVLASFHRRPLASAQRVLATANRVAILEDVNNHTNVGAIFRGAAALGMDAVLLSPSCADPLYRRSVRVSMGEVFAVPYARLEPWPAALDTVRQAGFSVLALTPAPDARAIQRLDAAHRRRPALLLGAEGAGLSRHALAASDQRVAIPMFRGVDSLNVAAAAAVAFWELCRDAPPPQALEGQRVPDRP